MEVKTLTWTRSQRREEEFREGKNIQTKVLLQANKETQHIITDECQLQNGYCLPANSKSP
jgi:hypothetical protein